MPAKKLTPNATIAIIEMKRERDFFTVLNASVIRTLFIFIFLPHHSSSSTGTGRSLIAI